MGNSKETESLEPPRGTPIEVISHRYPRIPREEETTLLLHEKQKPLRKKTRYLAQEQQEGWSLFQVVKLTLTTFFVCSTVLFISRFVFMYNLVHYSKLFLFSVLLCSVIHRRKSHARTGRH